MNGVAHRRAWLALCLPGLMACEAQAKPLPDLLPLPGTFATSQVIRAGQSVGETTGTKVVSRRRNGTVVVRETKPGESVVESFLPSGRYTALVKSEKGERTFFTGRWTTRGQRVRFQGVNAKATLKVKAVVTVIDRDLWRTSFRYYNNKTGRLIATGSSEGQRLE